MSVTKLSDAEWLSRAHKRASQGQDWQSAPAEVHGGPFEPAREDGTGLECPSCGEGHWLERIGQVPELRFCRRCYAVWAPEGALSQGIDSDAEHPALRAAPGPARCRSCYGHLDADDACRKCGKTLPAIDCPSCGTVMERSTVTSVTLDACPQCGGTWFDVGEVCLAYGLAPPRSLAERVVGEAPPEQSDGDLLLMALTIVGRILLRV